MVILAIILFFILSALMITESNSERNRLKMEYYSFSSGKLRRKYRILFLSDLHEKEFGERNGELLNKIREVNPDFILLGGDLIVSKRYRRGRSCWDKVEKSIVLLKQLKKEFTIFMGMGNHETRMLEKAGLGSRREAETEEIEKEKKIPAEVQRESRENVKKWQEALRGIRVLDRETIKPEEFPDIQISGLTLPMEYYKKLFFRKKKSLSAEEYREYIGENRLKETENSRFRIVLLHSPLYHKEAIREGADLVLSGHFHGGTIRLPFLGGLMTPQFQFFKRECSGVFPYQNGWMLVNRGLGTHSINIRLNDLPEISVIELLPEEGEAKG